jgi:hypothetical protein
MSCMHRDHRNNQNPSCRKSDHPLMKICATIRLTDRNHRKIKNLEQCLPQKQIMNITKIPSSPPCFSSWTSNWGLYVVLFRMDSISMGTQIHLYRRRTSMALQALTLCLQWQDYDISDDSLVCKTINCQYRPWVTRYIYSIVPCFSWAKEKIKARNIDSVAECRWQMTGQLIYKQKKSTASLKVWIVVICQQV